MINVDEVLNEPISKLKGVGKKLSLAYKKLGVCNCFDLICHFPVDYYDCSCLVGVSDAVSGNKCCVRARILKKMPVLRRVKLLIAKCLAVDDKEQHFELVFFNSDFLYRKLELFKSYIFFGKIEKSFCGVQMVAPRVISKSEMGFLPKYGLTNGLSSAVVSKHVKQVLEKCSLVENLPKHLLQQFNLVSREEAFLNVHFPKTKLAMLSSRKRLVFEEVFFWQLSLKLLKRMHQKKTNFQLISTDLNKFFSVLPFKLTPSQLQVLGECVTNCCNGVVMNRLIQGDVGCGKTVIAQAMSFLFARSKFQVAVMAPTEILAIQHFKSFKSVFEKLNIKVALLTGSLKTSQISVVLENLIIGKIDVLIGTHSLFSTGVAFYKLGLVITDEQHRFGVLQRIKLIQKGNIPHVIAMSATPVPRTLAMVTFADMDVSVVKKAPVGKAKVKTVHITPNKRARVFSYIAKEVEKGRQAYIVCPLIEEGKKNVVSVQNYFENLKKLDVFKNVKLDILHGKLTSDQKTKLMMKFIRGDVDVLIATSVVEVGIDNPNASVILIENAECFGLASLHQLRGRVGRGKFDSVCVLVSSSKNEQSLNRMAAMCATNDGFKIAQFDLKLRGPGHFFGTLQHGLPNFKIANLVKHLNLIKICSNEVNCIFASQQSVNRNKNLLLMAKKELNSTICNFLIN